MSAGNRLFLRYALALVAVGAALLLREALGYLVGPGLPTYVTFYPAVMLVALLAGIGPGVLATVTAALVVDYRLLPPQGQFGIEKLVDAVGLVLFSGMGVLMSVVVGLYRRTRGHLEELVTVRTAALDHANAQLKQVNVELEQRVAVQTAEIRKANESLEQRVAARTVEIQAANEALRASRVAAMNLMEDAIVARQKAEDAKEALRESEQRFRTMAESIPQLAWMAQPDGHIFWYNRRWYEYTGTTLEQMEGWGWQAVHDPDELPRVLERWKAAIAEGKPWEDTFPLRRHDGAMRPHLSRAVPICDQEGRVVRWFGTNTDITERIEMEEALQRARKLPRPPTLLRANSSPA